MNKQRRLRPPEHLREPLSRSEAAELLGFASEFKVRALERAGTLRATRGIMGSAWYPRADVLRVRDALAALQPVLKREDVRSMPAGRASRQPSDAELIGYLRRPVPPGAPLRTVADLVADMGINIARAQKVFRFWLAHDAHPSATAVRVAQGDRDRSVAIPTAPDAAPSSERRSPTRVARAALIRELRAPDPAVRKAAFEQLKRRRPSADAS